MMWRASRALAVAAEDAQAMGLVHHDDHILEFFLDGDDFRQRGQVAFHGKDAVHDDQFDGILGSTLDQALQLLHVVVLVLLLLGEGEPAAVHDGGVVAVIAEDEIALAYQAGNDAGVDRETGRQAKRLVLADKGSQFFFKLDMDIEGSVQEARAGATGTILFHGFNTGVDDAVIPGQARIGIGSEHQDVVSLHFDFGALLALNFAEIGVNPLFLHLLRQVILGESFVQKIHYCQVLVTCEISNILEIVQTSAEKRHSLIMNDIFLLNFVSVLYLSLFVAYFLCRLSVYQYVKKCWPSLLKCKQKKRKARK